MAPSFLNLFIQPEQLTVSKNLTYVFQNNAAAITQWNLKFQKFQTDQLLTIEALQKSLLHVDLAQATKQRLKTLLEAETLRLSEVQVLANNFLPPFENTPLRTTIENRIPSQQHFSSYIKNVFRDWAWGEVENKFYTDILKNIQLTTGQALIVGGGAGRLLADLCLLKPDLNCIQIDINPLLSHITKQLCSGESLSLTEISTHNFDLNRLAKTHLLKGHFTTPLKNFESIVGDILNHPFKDSVFDLVVCPWVVDILPEPFTDFARRLNLLLKTDGELVIFGPLSFEKHKCINQHSTQELAEILTSSGFQITQQEELTVPYLQSPIESQKRTEEIVYFKVKKIKHAKKPKNFVYLPDWLTNPSLNINPEIADSLKPLQAQKNIEAQFLAALLSGQTINSMAEAISKSGSGMSLQQAHDFVTSQFTRLFESGDLKL